LGVLIIGAADQKRIDALVAQARAHPVPWEALAPAAILSDRPMLMIDEVAAKAPPGWKRPTPRGLTLGSYDVAFSFEVQPVGLLRHLSVSCKALDKVPMPIVVERIARAFGFTGDVRRVWIEEYAPGRLAANVVELVEPAAGSAVAH